MAQWVSEVNSRNKQDSYLVFDLIKEFLQNAGQSQMVVQVNISMLFGQEVYHTIGYLCFLTVSLISKPNINHNNKSCFTKKTICTFFYSISVAVYPVWEGALWIMLSANTADKSVFGPVGSVRSNSQTIPSVSCQPPSLFSLSPLGCNFPRSTLSWKVTYLLPCPFVRKLVLGLTNSVPQLPSFSHIF